MRHRPYIIFTFLFIFSLGFTPMAFAKSKSKVIKSIEVQGNKRVDKKTILFYVKAKKGNEYSLSLINEDIKAIYNLGHFEDIRVEEKAYLDGVKLIYIVKEIPSIRDIIFVGNKKISTKDLEEKIGLANGSFYNKSEVKKAEKIIKNLYEEKGYFFAAVQYSIKNVEEDQVDLKFKILEKRKVGIKKINFIGNKAFSDKKLKKQLNTKEKNIFSIFTSSGIYQKEMIKTDVLRLELFYRENGFINVKVLDPQIEIKKKERAIFIAISIQEGKQYRAGKIEFIGDDTFSEKKLREKIELKKGDIYNLSKIREGVFNIAELYSQRGYAFADVRPDIQVNDRKKNVDVVLRIDRGRKVYIGKITIEGNLKTKDKVIRREFRFNEGELFDSIKLKRSRERIVNTGFFEDVQIKTSRGEKEDTIDITSSVVERPTGTIAVGLGYSSLDNAIFTGQVSQENLFGNGQKVMFSTELSSRRSDFSLSLTEPRLFDREISFGVDLFNVETDFFSFQSKKQGGGVRFGKSFSEYIWGNIGYKYEQVTIFGVDQGNETNFLKNEKRVTSQITPSIVRDTRDNILNPTRGTRETFNAQLAGGILGGLNFYKFSVDKSYYHPLFLGLVGMLHGKLAFGKGYGGDVLPIYERFFMGGPLDLRGFNFNNVGPKDKKGDSLGGDKMLLLNAEIQYPFSNNIRGIIFYDRGNVYGEGDDVSLTKKDFDLLKMRHSVGVAVKFYSPIGPIGLAYGFKLDKAKGESPSEFHFILGRSF